MTMLRRTPLKRGGPLRRRKPIPFRSAKMAALYRNERIPLVREILGLDDGGRPCVRCGQLADTVHEPLGRGRGGSIVDRKNAVPMCAVCNEWCSNGSPKQAELEGFVVHSWAAPREPRPVVVLTRHGNVWR